MSLFQKALFWARAFSVKNVEPDLRARTLNEVPLGWLREKGIKLVLLDVDQTLTGYHGSSVDERVKGAVTMLRENFSVYLVSNAPERRLQQLYGLFGIPVVTSGHGKPYPDRLLWAMEDAGVGPKETVMIGDRAIMDVYAARNAGAYAALVEPLAPKTDPLTIKASRGLEQLVFAEMNS